MLDRLTRRLSDIRDGEIRAVLWSFLYFFCLLASYFILRPLRDEMGLSAGREALPSLFTATFFAMLAAAPLYAAAIARLRRALFIPLVYRFFIANLVIFWVLLALRAETVWTARTFFVWVSVFNLFAVSVFWSFMADLFRTDQGKRLFGFIAAGGTAGTLLGSSLTVSLAGLIGPANLLIVAAVLLEAAVFCARRLERAASGAGWIEASRASAPATGGGVWAGFRLIISSPYLAGIAAWVALLSLANTFLYFIQQDVVRAASTDPALRTQIFAAMDLAANLLTLLVQLLAAGRLIKHFGAGPAAALAPLVFALGFGALALAPSLALLVAFQVAQRTIGFAFSNPARELFFTSVEREEKYKAKNLIDTVVFRGGDLVWSWTFTGLLHAIGTALGVAAAAIPVMILWAGVALALGRAQERRLAYAKITEDTQA